MWVFMFVICCAVYKINKILFYSLIVNFDFWLFHEQKRCDTENGVLDALSGS